ncbi:MAG: hypothetical protein WA126_15985 [Thermodesulfovibrionales bacterium]
MRQISISYAHAFLNIIIEENTADVPVSYIETNLYDVKTEKLIWSAHTKTERTEGEQQLINTFIKVMIKKLASDKIIQ